MNSFVEILKQFSPKHKAWVLLMLLAFTSLSFLGGKYIDSKQKAADIVYIDSIKTVVDRNCELQKQELLKTQSIMQGQINDILSDLITLRQLVIKSGEQEKYLEEVKSIEAPLAISYLGQDSIFVEADFVRAPEPNYIVPAKDTYKELCIKKLNHLIKQTKQLTK